MTEAAATTKSFEVEARYLHLPVRFGALKRRVAISSGGVRREFEIELAADPEWWAFVDLESLPGPGVTVELMGDGDPALDLIHQSDEIVGAETMYQETRRPQLRFSSRRGWLNDPNGLVFHDGEYHLFYQHNPYGTSWSNMHWGHAVSTDLLHWQELPISHYPDESGEMYTGSAVVDHDDTAGLQEGADPALITFYTAAKIPFSQRIAASQDRGRTWVKYSGNPVLPSPESTSRDPMVIWHAPTGRWIMALYLDRFDHVGELDHEAYQRLNSYGLYSSADLTHWDKRSEYVIPGDSECPEFFELPIDGSPGESRWITFGAMGFYLVGSFDGERFTPESGPHVLSSGNAFYASQTFTDIPAADGRRILIPWARSWPEPGSTTPPVISEMPFAQSMGIPVELTLRSSDDGPRVFANPIREFAGLRAASTRIEEQSLRPGDDPLAAFAGELWDIEADIAVGDASAIVFDIRGTRIGYDVERREVSCGDTTARLDLVDGRLLLRLLVDRVAIDIFGDDGRLYMPMGVDLTSGARTLSLRAEGGDAVVTSLDVHQLESIWRS